MARDLGFWDNTKTELRLRRASGDLTLDAVTQLIQGEQYVDMILSSGNGGHAEILISEVTRDKLENKIIAIITKVLPDFKFPLDSS